MNPEMNDVPGFVEAHINELRQQFQQELQAALEQQRMQLLEQFRQNGSGSTRMPTNLEKFSGKLGENPQEWAFTMDASFNASHVLEQDKVNIAITCLRDAARTWWRNRLMEPNPPANWNDFVVELIQAFQSINPVKEARDRLARLKQTKSVRAYATAFKATALEIPGITDDEKRDRFIRGLKSNTQKEVELRDPATFEDAVGVAERYDAISYRIHNYESAAGGLARNMSGNGQRSTTFSEAQPMELGNINQASKTFTKLTPEIREQLKQEGRCLYCREKGHVVQNCQKLKTKHPKDQRQ